MPIMYYSVLLLAGLFLGWLLRWLYGKLSLLSLEHQILRLKESAQSVAEQEKKEILLSAQNEILRERKNFEKEIREQKQVFNRVERRLQQKEDSLTSREEEHGKKVQEVERARVHVRNQDKEREEQIAFWKQEIEKVASMTTEEAKQIIIRNLEQETRKETQNLMAKVEKDLIADAQKKAQSILISALQRLSTEVSTEYSISSVSLPNDEIKGRIIGREGRNIRTLETLTGVDIIIDDTPESVVISCFDPVRRVIAKQALERLIADGRIHPVRIEEVVEKVEKEVEQTIAEKGEKLLFDLGIHNIPKDGVRMLGRMHFRTSYGQNILNHSKEVALLAGTIAAELGADVEIAKRGGLFHDIGKVIPTDGETTHTESGGEFCRRLGEDPRVVNAVAGHHNDIELTSPEGYIVQIADAVSASRPGARQESLENYLKRLENLEKIALEYDGVDKVFAIQAGRELRIIVNSETVDDETVRDLAKRIAQKIETELTYPGRIKVTLIRERKAVEYAC